MAPPAQRQTEVLIVGAGPTGLVLALWLKRLGVDVRIVDKTAEPGTTSRALAVHARTLELYRQMGMADEVVERGLKFAAINLWARGVHRARVSFGDIGEGSQPLPVCAHLSAGRARATCSSSISQRAGVEVERHTELLGFREVRRRRARSAGARGRRKADCEAAYIAGCDGARSKVREVLGVGFPGGTYDHVFYVADVALHGPMANGELNVALDDGGHPRRLSDEGRKRRAADWHRHAHAPKRPTSRSTWNDVGQSLCAD